MANETALLIHFESDFSDSSTFNHTPTVIGNTVIDNTIFKVGSGSGGGFGPETTEDALRYPYNSIFDFGSGDFELNLRFRMTALQSVNQLGMFIALGRPGFASSCWPGFSLAIKRSFSGTNHTIDFTWQTGTTCGTDFGTVRWHVDNNGSTTLLNIEQWYQIRLIRRTTQLSAFLDGTQLTNFRTGDGVIGTDTILAYNSVDPGDKIHIGAQVGTSGASESGLDFEFDGNIDELFIINGQLPTVANGIDGTGGDAVFCPFVEDGQVRKMVDSITGLNHLEGEGIEVQMDGILPTNSLGKLVTNLFTVSSGAITLPKKAAVVHAGLPYDGIIKLLKSSDGSVIGSGQTKMRRTYLGVVRFFKSLGLKIGPNEDNLVPIFDGVPTLPLISSDKRKLPVAPWDDETEMVFKMEDPLPCLILMILLESEVEEKG